jgi:UDP-N-acetylglucosamine diphosphorylase/glucosamine-1-phosphate N-acetyltransferase
MNFILFDEPSIRQGLLPFTFTRPVAEVRIGILTIAEKWKWRSGLDVSYITEDYLSDRFTLNPGKENVFINGGVCPTDELVAAIKNLNAGEIIVKGGVIIAYKKVAEGKQIEFHQDLTIVKRPWDIFLHNGKEIKEDFALITRGRTSAPLSDPYTRTYNPENIFIEEGASVKAAILNAENGPIYLGRNSEVMEGAIIRGPFALGEGATISMGAKFRGDSTVGPYSKIGGEVSNSVVFGYTNKAHDGFLGNSVIGEWCNLGADTNTSNLKNTYSPVSVYSYKEQDFINSGKMFCGLLMGDHSKCGINTMFNTGTVVGVYANIFGEGYPAKFVPSFAWGGGDKNYSRYNFEKVVQVAERVMSRRNIQLSQDEIKILRYIYDIEDQQVRNF